MRAMEEEREPKTRGKILYFVYEPIDEDPPCVAQVCTLRDLGYQVHVVTKQCHPAMETLFREKGITWETFDVAAGRVKTVYKFRKFCSLQRHLRRALRNFRKEEYVFWIGSDRTVMVPGQRGKLIRRHPLVLSCLEFYEKPSWQKVMRRFARAADAVLACEPHRAALMKEWWNLPRIPYVLPNKPYGLTAFRNMEPTSPGTAKAVSVLEKAHRGGRKILIYQGLISERRDLKLLAEALAAAASGNEEYAQRYVLALMGPESPEGSAEKIRSIYPETVYLGRFYFPQHLEVTSHADIGIAYYKDDTINNRYCAPNKIYEYGCLGLPMLCNTVPGLTETVGKAGAAECVDFAEPGAVAGALGRIESAYEVYSRRARQFYDGTDNTAVIREAAEAAFSSVTVQRNCGTKPPVSGTRTD